jgi:IS30 family transposase
MLVHLPHGDTADAVRKARTETAQVLPPHLMQSLTWDQGVEMTAHRQFTVATGIPVYCRTQQPPTQNARLGDPSRASV